MERLGVDHLELFQIRAWDLTVPLETWLCTLDEVSAPPTPAYPYGLLDDIDATRRAETTES